MFDINFVAQTRNIGSGKRGNMVHRNGRLPLWTRGSRLRIARNLRTQELFNCKYMCYLLYVYTTACAFRTYSGVSYAYQALCTIYRYNMVGS
jgi:hypothetical protein